MKRTYWILGACLSLLLIGGMALEVSAQQTPPPAAAPSTTTPDSSTSPSSPTTTPPAAPGTMQRDNPSATTPPPGNTQIETRSTERTTVVDRDGGRIFGVQPAVALVVGAAVLVVIVIGLVAMSRRSDEVTHTHRV